jgi:acyl dehydratase
MPFTVTDADMRAFAALSGDPNPLHTDAAFARDRGFAAPVVYGGLIVARISALLGGRLPGPGCVWHSLRLDFRAPLHPGEPAAVEARVVHRVDALSLVRLAVEVRTQDRLVARGEVQAALARARSAA